jgi:hypothetical protein
LFVYQLQGLLVASSQELVGLTLRKSDARPDVVFHAGLLPRGLDVGKLQDGAPAYVSPYSDPSGEPFSRMWRCPQSGIYFFRFIEGFSFAIDSGGKTIWAQWPERVSMEDITAFLLGQILAFVSHLRGSVCLHASAVSIGGCAVLFAGFPGMGKSTTAAAFAVRGHSVLSDDVSTLRRETSGGISVLPGVPRVCLLPDSAEFLYGRASSEQFPLLQPAEEKRLVRLDTLAGKFQAEATPLEAIFLLAPRSDDATAPRIEEIAGAERLIRLMYNGFMNLAIDKNRSAQEFQIMGEIARSVRVRQLVPSSDPKKLDRLCELVASDIRASTVSSLSSLH